MTLRPIESAFDRWLSDSGSLGVRDLARYRVIYASVTLLLLPHFTWIADLPAASFAPPPGPFRLVPAVPPVGALVAIEVLLAVALGFLLVGLGTRIASVATAALLTAGYGLSYSFGKIDHTVLLLITPLFLAVAGWGGALSVDAVRAARAGRSLTRRPWAMRWLAIAVGVGFAMAGLPKLLGGWLSPGSQAVYGYLLKQYFTNGRQDLLAPFFVDLRFPLFWESMDWATLAFELGVIVCAVSWRAFRLILAIGCLFHLGVWLMMNITFTPNVLVYGAFVTWSAVRLPVPARVPAMPRSVGVATAAVAAPAIGVAAWAATRVVDPIGPISAAVIIGGAVLGAAYLALWAARTGLAWVPVLRGQPGRPVLGRTP